MAAGMTAAPRRSWGMCCPPAGDVATASASSTSSRGTHRRPASSHESWRHGSSRTPLLRRWWHGWRTPWTRWTRQSTGRFRRWQFLAFRHFDRNGSLPWRRFTRQSQHVCRHAVGRGHAGRFGPNVRLADEPDQWRKREPFRRPRSTAVSVLRRRGARRRRHERIVCDEQSRGRRNDERPRRRVGDEQCVGDEQSHRRRQRLRVRSRQHGWQRCDQQPWREPGKSGRVDAIARLRAFEQWRRHGCARRQRRAAELCRFALGVSAATLRAIESRVCGNFIVFRRQSQRLRRSARHSAVVFRRTWHCTCVLWRTWRSACVLWRTWRSAFLLRWARCTCLLRGSRCDAVVFARWRFELRRARRRRRSCRSGRGAFQRRRQPRGQLARALRRSRRY